MCHGHVLVIFTKRWMSRRVVHVEKPVACACRSITWHLQWINSKGASQVLLPREIYSIKKKNKRERKREKKEQDQWVGTADAEVPLLCMLVRCLLLLLCILKNGGIRNKRYLIRVMRFLKSRENFYVQSGGLISLTETRRS